MTESGQSFRDWVVARVAPDDAAWKARLQEAGHSLVDWEHFCTQEASMPLDMISLLAIHLAVPLEQVILAILQTALHTKHQQRLMLTASLQELFAPALPSLQAEIVRLPSLSLRRSLLTTSAQLNAASALGLAHRASVRLTACWVAHLAQLAGLPLERVAATQQIETPDPQRHPWPQFLYLLRRSNGFSAIGLSRATGLSTGALTALEAGRRPRKPMAQRGVDRLIAWVQQRVPLTAAEVESLRSWLQRYVTRKPPRSPRHEEAVPETEVAATAAAVPAAEVASTAEDTLQIPAELWQLAVQRRWSLAQLQWLLQLQEIFPSRKVPWRRLLAWLDRQSELTA